MTKELSRGCADTYYTRGIASSEKGEVELAIEGYTEAIALDPQFAEAYYQRGLTYAKNGELDKSIQDYTKAIALKSDYADAYYRRSKVWLHLGETEKAKADMKTASKIGINSRTALDETLKKLQSRMENPREPMRYLAITEILEVAEGHVGTYHLLDENRLHYLVEAVRGKFGSKKPLCMHIISLQDIYFLMEISGSACIVQSCFWNLTAVRCALTLRIPLLRSVLRSRMVL